MQTLTIRDNFIKLGQALKLSGLVSSGVDAKILIQGGEVRVNGRIETQRGKKLVHGDIIEYEGAQFQIESEIHED